MRMRGRFQTIAETAFQPLDVASLAVFRFLAGLILLWEVVRFFVNGVIDSVYLLPRFHFTYLGFGWVRPWPDEGMTLHFVMLGLAALGVALGFWYRLSAAWLCIGWTYVLLLEQTTYLNHLYLICLLALLLVFVPTHRAWSLDAWRQPKSRSDVVPAIALWTLRAQIAIPYVYGALAKLNGDWLQGQPMQLWMSRMQHVRAVIPAFGELWLALVLSWGGFLLDLLVVPALLWRRTRVPAFVAAVVFHLCNAVMFRIGIFPWFMIGATTLFLEPNWPRRLLRFLRAVTGGTSLTNGNRVAGGVAGDFHALPRTQGVSPESAKTPVTLDVSARRRRVILAAVSAWFLVQLTVPFRHWLIEGDVDWTEEGARFAWRMMLCDKACALGLVAIDRKTQQVAPIDPRKYLMPFQLDKLGQDPDLVLQFAQFIARELRETQGQDVEVRARVLCSLNGRRPQLLIDPQVDLARETRWRWHQPWIIPLQESLPEQPWAGPPNTWGDLLKLGE